MDSYKLMYKPIKTNPPYAQYLQRLEEKEESENKHQLYGEMLKYKEARYPKQFLDVLEKQINPFEFSLDQLKKNYNHQYPDYPTEIVNQSIEFVFKKKARQAKMIKESQYVIEYGDEYIRNGRKLVKEDFTYNYGDFSFQSQPPTDRTHFSQPDNYSPLMTNRSQTPQRLQKFLQNSVIFNEVLQNQIKKERSRFENMTIILQDEPHDLINLNDQQRRAEYTERSANESFPAFREKDIIIQPQFLDTGRSDAEELNYLLAEVAKLGEEGGSETSRSVYTTKLTKDNKTNIYDAQGRLKRHILRRAVSRLKKVQGFE